MQLAAYTRVSTEEQVKSGSLDQQRKQIEDFCKIQKHELVKIFSDAGISAVKLRPDIEKVMTFLRDGKAEGIVVTKLDRWGRSVKHLVTSVDELKGSVAKFR